MNPRKFTVRWSAEAKTMLEAIQDRRIQAKLYSRAEGLSEEPGKQGKPLTEDLAGYRSLLAVGQRYRILYRIEEKKALVLIVALGIRKEGSKRDVYVLARKLLRLRLV